MIEEFRKTAPVPSAPKTFNIPQPFETTLSNGLKVIIFQNSKLPILSLRLGFLTGDINDPEDSKGLTTALTALLTQGTKTRTSREIADEIEKLGASINSGSTLDNTIISASCLSVYKSEVLNLMADILLNPSFPEDEIRLYKENTIKSLEFQRSQSEFLADEQTARLIYGEHPYSIVSPQPSDVEKITREQLFDHHKRILIPNNAMLIAVGDIEKDDFIAELNELFKDWQQGTTEKKNFAELPTHSARTLTIVDRPGSAQSNIVLSNSAIERKNPDFFAVSLMNQILGAGASSRLFMNLREEKGYTYGAYSSFDSKRLAGAFEATAEVRSAVTGEALKEFFYEIEKMRDEKVSETELKDAKNYLTGVFPIRAETLEGLTNLIVSQKLYSLPDDYLQTYRQKINEITIEDVNRVAQKYLHPDKIAIVIVGDAEDIINQAKPFAEKVEVFDTEGNPQELSKYEQTENQTPAEIDGKWNLIVEMQGQKIPISLDLKQEKDKFSGVLESPLGTGTIKDGVINGNKIKSGVEIDFQGQEFVLSLNGNYESDNSIKGNLSASALGLPDLSFTATRD